MSAAEFIQLVEAVGEAVKRFPLLASSLADFFGALGSSRDPSHAMRQVKGQAALAFLGLDEPKGKK